MEANKEPQQMHQLTASTAPKGWYNSLYMWATSAILPLTREGVMKQAKQSDLYCCVSNEVYIVVPSSARLRSTIHDRFSCLIYYLNSELLQLLTDYYLFASSNHPPIVG